MRLDVSTEVSGAAWGIDPALLRGLALVESSHEYNPKRYGTRERWGNPPLGRRWNYCGLMQLRGGGQPMGCSPRVKFPPCELLVVSPELSVWYACVHLVGWRRQCGDRWFDCYNAGSPGKTNDGSFGREVRRHARRFR